MFAGREDDPGVPEKLLRSVCLYRIDGQPTLAGSAAVDKSLESILVDPAAESAAVLDEVAVSLHAWPEVKVEIQGHTDSTGSDEHNLDLSRRRAATVKSYLLLYGISGDRLTTTGLGESKPVGDNATEEGRALNRRVELFVKPIVEGEEERAYESPQYY